MKGKVSKKQRSRKTTPSSSWRKGGLRDRSKRSRRSRGLWAFNSQCPYCGRRLKNHKIRAAETGLSYCSDKCASKHVNGLAKQGYRW